MGKVHGFTKKQREWFLRRDGHRCMFREFVDGKWVRCGRTDNLQVHHILPRGFASRHFPADFPVNGKGNGITLCDYHHIGKGNEKLLLCIHPDTEQARLAYAHDQHSYEKMMTYRELLSGAGIPYWSTAFDWMLYRLVTKQNVFGEPYPE